MNLFSAAALALVLASSLVTSKAAHAFEETWQTQRDQEQVWVVIHSEAEQHFVVDTFKKKQGELQDLVQSRTFANLSEAKQFAHEERKRVARTPQWEVRSLDETSDEGLEKSFTDDLPLPSLPPLWEVRHAWTWEWEQTYGRWVSENLNAQFFSNHKIATDCADAAFATRWIFARIHGLPAANRLGASRAIFSQDSNREDWLALPTDPIWHQDRRFLAALNYLLRNTFTHSLGRDTYPIAMTPEAVLPGTIELHIDGTSGHTLILHQVGAREAGGIPLMTINSTVPRAVRDLSVQAFSMRKPEQGSLSLVRPLWPELTPEGWRLAEAEQMPHYSTGQFADDLLGEDESFSMWLMQRIDPSFDPARLFVDVMSQLERMIQERITIVQDGFEACKTVDCSPGTPGWENWSTPSRDGRIGETWVQATLLMDRLDDIDPDLMKRWNRWVAQPKFEIEGRKYSVERVLWNHANGLLDSDPRVAPEERWRLTPQSYLEKTLTPWKTAFKARNERALNSENPCREKLSERECQPQGASFALWDTTQEDKNLFGDFGKWTALEPLLDPTERTEWNHYLQATLETPWATQQWLKHLTLLNGDPRAALEQRRGAPVSDLKHLAIVRLIDNSLYYVGEVLWVDDQAITFAIRHRSSWKQGLFRYTFADEKTEIIQEAAFLSPAVGSDVVKSETGSPLFWTTTAENDEIALRVHDFRGNLVSSATIPGILTSEVTIDHGNHLSSLEFTQDRRSACATLSDVSYKPRCRWIDFSSGEVAPVSECGENLVRHASGEWTLYSRRPGLPPRSFRLPSGPADSLNVIENDDGWLAQGQGSSSHDMGPLFWVPRDGGEIILLAPQSLDLITPVSGRLFSSNEIGDSGKVKLLEVDLTGRRLVVRQEIQVKDKKNQEPPTNPFPDSDEDGLPGMDSPFQSFHLSSQWGGVYYSTLPLFNHKGTRLFRWNFGNLLPVPFAESGMAIGLPLDLKTARYWTASTEEPNASEKAAIYRWDGQEGFTRWSPFLEATFVREVARAPSLTLRDPNRLLYFSPHGPAYVFDGDTNIDRQIPVLTNLLSADVDPDLGVSKHRGPFQMLNQVRSLPSFLGTQNTTGIAIWNVR